MAFIATPHGARIVINWTKSAETYSYVFYATKDGFDSTAQQELADAVDTMHSAAIRAYFASQVAYLNTTVYDARYSDGGIVVATAHAGAGTAASEALPLNAAVCVTLYTSGRGRSSRGRKYITGFGEGSNTAGEWSSNAVGYAHTYVENVCEAIESVGWTPVIRSIQQDKVKLDPAVTRAITSHVVRSAKAATQRRRVDRP